MELFADAAANAQGWVLVATTLVGGVTSMVSAYFAMKSAAERVTLLAKVAQLEATVAECHAERVTLRAEVVRLTAQNAGQQSQLDAGKAAAADLTSKVGRLVALLRANGLADTGEHTPAKG